MKNRSFFVFFIGCWDIFGAFLVGFTTRRGEKKTHLRNEYIYINKCVCKEEKRKRPVDNGCHEIRNDSASVNR